MSVKVSMDTIYFPDGPIFSLNGDSCKDTIRLDATYDIKPVDNLRNDKNADPASQPDIYFNYQEDIDTEPVYAIQGSSLVPSIELPYYGNEGSQPRISITIQPTWNGDIPTASVAPDGIYGVEINAEVDKKNKEGKTIVIGEAQSATGCMVLDNTRPSINIVNPKDEEYLSINKPLMEVSYSDALSGVDLSSFDATLTHNGNIIDLANRFNLSCDGANYQVSTPLEDGKYFLNTSIKDLACNPTSTSIVFYVCTNPPATPTITTPGDWFSEGTISNVCATTTSSNISASLLYINNTYVSMQGSIPDPSERTQICFNNVSLAPGLLKAGANSVTVTVINNVGCRTTGYGSVTLHPMIKKIIPSAAKPGDTVMILGEGFDAFDPKCNPDANYVMIGNEKVLLFDSNGNPLYTLALNVSNPPDDPSNAPTVYDELTITIPQDVQTGLVTVVVNGVASGIEGSNSGILIVTRAIDKYADTGYTPVGISMALNDLDYPLIAATDGYKLYFRYWNGRYWTYNRFAAPPLNYLETPLITAYLPSNEHGWTLGIAPKISLAIDASGNPAIAYAEAVSLPNGTPAVSIYYLKGINYGNGEYSFADQQPILVDTITPCYNAGSYGFFCDPRWLDSNYSINLVFDTNPPPLYAAFKGAPVISYRSGDYTGNQVLKIAEFLGNIADIETVANALDAPAAYCDGNMGLPMWGAQDVSMNKDQSGNIGLVYNLAYCDNLTGPNQSNIYYIQRTTDANGFITWQNDVSGTGYSSASPSSLIINNGNPVFALDSEGYERILENTGGSSWKGIIIDTTHSNAASTALGFNDDNNKSAVSYYDFANNILKTADGDSWLPNIADIGIDVGSANAIAIDSTGKADIAYSDNFNKRLLFFQEANGDFILTNPNYINSPTSIDTNKFNKVSIPASTVNSLAINLMSDPSITYSFPLNLFALGSDSLTTFLFGALYRNDIITIDQNTNPASFTIKISAPAGKYLDSSDTIDMTLDLNALKSLHNPTLSITANYMDTFDPSFSDIPHNIALTVSSGITTITYTVDGGLYGYVYISSANRIFYGVPYGFFTSCPPGSSILAGVCEISNVTILDFLNSFFPPLMRLQLGFALGGTALQETVQQYFSSNSNIFTSLITPLGQLNSIRGLVDLINGNTDGFTASHAYITLNGIQYGLTGNGTYEGTMNFIVPIYAEVWGNYGDIGVRATCPGSINLPLSPDPYYGRLPEPVTANAITSSSINMFVRDNTRIPLFGYNCSLHISGNINQALYYILTHLFDISIPLGTSNTTLGKAIVNNMFLVPQSLTNSVVTTSPLSSFLSTPQVINSMVLSTNGLDVYMKGE